MLYIWMRIDYIINFFICNKTIGKSFSTLNVITIVNKPPKLFSTLQEIRKEMSFSYLAKDLGGNEKANSEPLEH